MLWKNVIANIQQIATAFFVVVCCTLMSVCHVRLYVIVCIYVYIEWFGIYLAGATLCLILKNACIVSQRRRSVACFIFCLFAVPFSSLFPISIHICFIIVAATQYQCHGNGIKLYFFHFTSRCACVYNTHTSRTYWILCLSLCTVLYGFIGLVCVFLSRMVLLLMFKFRTYNVLLRLACSKTGLSIQSA